MMMQSDRPLDAAPELPEAGTGHAAGHAVIAGALGLALLVMLPLAVNPVSDALAWLGLLLAGQ